MTQAGGLAYRAALCRCGSFSSDCFGNGGLCGGGVVTNAQPLTDAVEVQQMKSLCVKHGGATASSLIFVMYFVDHALKACAAALSGSWPKATFASASVESTEKVLPIASKSAQQ
eukprot:5828593-Pleurochrysis_carterae.AAC.2